MVIERYNSSGVTSRVAVHDTSMYGCSVFCAALFAGNVNSMVANTNADKIVLVLIMYPII
jgi:hypothetical protein